MLYENPKMEILTFGVKDVICDSGTYDETEVPTGEWQKTGKGEYGL